MTVRINSNLVRTLLARNNMTIAELADRTGLSAQTIHNLLGGADFKGDTLGKIADGLGTTPSRLIDPREVEVA